MVFCCRAWLVVVAGAALAAVPGCGGCTSNTEYPAELKYDARADRLVLQLPDHKFAKPNEGGKRDEELAALNGFGGHAPDPAAVPESERAALNQFLLERFGTPAAPKIDDPDSAAIIERLKLTPAHLVEGSKLFKGRCDNCHGLSGDGRGPGSVGLNTAYPRDYRRGQFKFVTSGDGMKPRRADLLRVLYHGVPGTAMPGFSLLQEGERDLIAGYVTLLSARGQIEFEVLAGHLTGQSVDPAARLKAVLKEWEAAENAPTPPTARSDGEPGTPAYEAAVRRGYQLFTKKVEKPAQSCIDCHGAFGREPVLRYDVWGFTARPANLTEPTLKGGSRPDDLYARIRYGIAPVGMPAHPAYTDNEVWDLVRFVQAAPFPVKLPEGEVRDAVYPKQ